MKKLTKRRLNWFRNRANRERRRKGRQFFGMKRRSGHPVTAWTGGSETEQIISRGKPVAPPALLCFHRNRDDTTAFLAELWHNFEATRTRNQGRERTWISYDPKRPLSAGRIRSYVDFARIEYLSTACAVVLAAGYDRLGTLLGKSPPTINLHLWSDHVFTKLFQLDFFKIVGLTPQSLGKYVDGGDTRTMPIVSGTDAAELQEVSERLADLSSFIHGGELIEGELGAAVRTALSEAMTNVAGHAYNEEHEYQIEHVGKWWVTAEADRVNRTLTIVFYDQGATIPITFQKKSNLWSRRVSDLFAKTLSPAKQDEFANDDAYIEGAMQRGNTQTSEPNRGLGLSQMVELIDICGHGRITIFSRTGACEYEPDGPIRKSRLPRSVGGTLIEWIIQIPEGTQHEQSSAA